MRKMPCLHLKYNRTQTLFSTLCLFARLLYALLIALLISLFGLHLKKGEKMILLAYNHVITKNASEASVSSGNN